jgi:hypothetical protein
LVGVGVGPDATGEHELNTIPVTTSSASNAQGKWVLLEEYAVDIIS